MSTNSELFIKRLQALTDVESDYNLAYRLHHLCQLIEDDPDSPSVIPYIFTFFEAHPNADFGSPGALVHFMEAGSDYEKHLIESVARKPIGHTILMINRILNSSLSHEMRAALLDLLRSVEGNPQADEVARDEAKHYLNVQAKRRRS